MSWGDPYDRLYKDGNYATRKADLVASGYVPGAAIGVGPYKSDANARLAQPMMGYAVPDLEGAEHRRLVAPGIGIIIAVDCESDPVINWVMASLPSFPAGIWFPIACVKLLKT